MTKREKSQYLSPNSNITIPHKPPVLLTDSPPASFDNADLGYVTHPKDQRSCRSCWIFTAVAAFEGAYARATGVLKSFSEKELLDCAYEGKKNGCAGGWYYDAWDYIGRTQRLAALRDAPYDYARDRHCNYGPQFAGSPPNGIRNAQYVNYHTVEPTDSELERAIARAVVAVAMTTEDDFYSYGSGIYDGCHGNKPVDHAVTIVGYTPTSWKVKNSWGREWGEKGYVRFSRVRQNMCRLADFAMYPIVVHIPRQETDSPDADRERVREPDVGCSWGDKFPCSEHNCNYGCDRGHCWKQCNGDCAAQKHVQQCGTCKEWCWLRARCVIHEDCGKHKYSDCAGICTF